jgi:hypothetical protein
MFAAVDAALARLYPTRRWDERDEAAGFDAGVPAAEGHLLAALAAGRLNAATVHRPGGPAETCDYVYVLCVGRTPCLAELREESGGAQALREALADGPIRQEPWEGSLDLPRRLRWAKPSSVNAIGQEPWEGSLDLPRRLRWAKPSSVNAIGQEPGEGSFDLPRRLRWAKPSSVNALNELYLRVALSTVAPFAAVQEVALSAVLDGEGAVVLTEAPRAGVFAPPLLRRMQLLVALLAERGIRHLDFGEIAEPPEGYQPGAYADEYGAAPTVANYFFYPQPPAAITTTTLT